MPLKLSLAKSQLKLESVLVTVEEIFGQNRFRDGVLLFAAVQRIEYALKRTGYRQGNKAEASWKKLGTALGRDFYQVVQGSKEADVFFRQPPAVLGLFDGELVWEDQAPPRDATELLDTVRNVRNSLFHGEKRFEDARDRKLVRAAVFVLDQALSAAAQSNDEGLIRFASVVNGFTPPLRHSPVR